MIYDYVFYILLVAIAIMLGRAVWFLKQIYRIMALQNRGVPDTTDMAKMSFEEMAKHKK